MSMAVRFWRTVRYHIGMRVILLMALAGVSLAQPSASIEAGRQLYLGSCSACHGASGEGSQGPSLLSGRVRRLSDRALFNTIKNGLPGTTMPNFDLPDAKIREITAFLKSLTAPAVLAPTSGDAARGELLFFGSSGCSGCHMIRGRGGYPGPDLSNIGADRTLHQLRESIVNPSARVEQGYRPASAILPSGQQISGVARNYNNYSVQVLDSKGKLHLLDRAAITKLEVKDTSMMPPANPAEAADLLAFLARQSTRSGQGGEK
jgi:cytochrome c oxidase cbb3-type subunit III